MGVHAHFVHHGHIGNGWKQFLAGLVVLILAGFGLYFAISDWRHGQIATGLLALGPFAGLAKVYAFGYLWCLPDVLSGISHDPGRN